MHDYEMIRIICGEEIMAHFPSGRVQFLSWWGCMKLFWWAVRTDTPIRIEDVKGTR